MTAPSTGSSPVTPVAGASGAGATTTPVPTGAGATGATAATPAQTTRTSGAAPTGATSDTPDVEGGAVVGEHGLAFPPNFVFTKGQADAIKRNAERRGVDLSTLNQQSSEPTS